MRKYIITGKVFPDFPTKLVRPIAPSTNPNKKGSLGFKIEKSVVIAEFAQDDFIEDFETVIKSVEHVIQGFVDSYSFINGNPYDVVMESLVENDVQKIYTEKTLHELLPELSSLDFPDIDQLFAFAFENLSLRFALSNFKNAKKYPAYTGLYVYLLVENVKKYLYPIDLKNESEEWKGLRESLSLTREEIDFAKTAADNVRHGKYQDVLSEDNNKVLILGAKVLYKFYNHLKSEKKAH